MLPRLNLNPPGSNLCPLFDNDLVHNRSDDSHVTLMYLKGVLTAIGRSLRKTGLSQTNLRRQSYREELRHRYPLVDGIGQHADTLATHHRAPSDRAAWHAHYEYEPVPLQLAN